MRRVAQLVSALGTRLWVMWIVFLIVHTFLLLWNVLGTATFAGDPAGDLTIYRGWLDWIGQYHIFEGVTTAWVYPLAAFAPIALAGIAGDSLYLLVWCLMVTALNALGVWMLTRHRRGAELDPRRRRAAWWWIWAFFLLGPVAMSRLDAVSSALGVFAVLVLAVRPWLAGVLLALGTWIKVWPVAFIVALVTASKKRWHYVVTGVGVSVLVAAAGLIIGTFFHVNGARYLFSFVSTQDGRGVQIESPFALPWLWARAVGVPGVIVHYDTDILTFQVHAWGVDTAATLSTPALLAALVVVLLLGVRAVIRKADATAVVVPLTMGIVASMLLFNKVGSPQYQSWFVPIVILALVTSHPHQNYFARAVALAAVLTQVIYPLTYWLLLETQWYILLVLTVRNGLEVFLFVVAIVSLWRIPKLRPSLTIRAEPAAIGHSPLLSR